MLDLATAPLVTIQSEARAAHVEAKEVSDRLALILGTAMTMPETVPAPDLMTALVEAHEALASLGGVVVRLEDMLRRAA